ncbi:hypothetical protein TVAG_208970 [Trichomonas vaginalis G3]|uniref:Uncharacterized protein n=1 Tax=Trichomonas vaginalis (strain ATCC PRA-98 / G3) TaxID=412133 RepID=A2DVD9_TRIV3|nr:hypothetical protein TVAGG3_0335280 [Trichomonas vaginalis G3]EAY15618.1 hypothetical protein TVAG_208970 [Trichomonas vaginalis G3]KAI5530225.1 hypothetical protein TVAGG3_0335280 [Trichomonas vaginalis G3]|eukprot:XP_001327841.1 hypothetical protein [Trichomonas vaginalis G3]
MNTEKTDVENIENGFKSLRSQALNAINQYQIVFLSNLDIIEKRARELMDSINSENRDLDQYIRENTVEDLTSSEYHTEMLPPRTARKSEHHHAATDSRSKSPYEQDRHTPNPPPRYKEPEPPRRKTPPYRSSEHGHNKNPPKAVKKSSKKILSDSSDDSIEF